MWTRRSSRPPAWPTKLAAEKRIRLQLREVGEADAELDRRAQSKSRERQLEALAKREAETKAERERGAEEGGGTKRNTNAHGAKVPNRTGASAAVQPFRT